MCVFMYNNIKMWLATQQLDLTATMHVEPYCGTKYKQQAQL